MWCRGTTHSSNGDRLAYGAKHTLAAVLIDEALWIRDLIAHQAAERADAFTDDVAGCAAKLLADTVRDLRQVVEVEAQVVRQSSCLAAEVLDHLQVFRLVLLARERQHIARVREHLERDLGSRIGEQFVMAARCHDRLPAARLTKQTQARVAAVAVRILLAFRSGKDERVRLEHPQSDFICRGELAIGALIRPLAAVLRGPMKPLLLEFTIDHHRDPPAGHAVLAQLEQSARHRL